MWEHLSENEKILLIKDRIFQKLINSFPSYWEKKGYLKKKLVYLDDDTRPKVSYSITKKAFKDMKRLAEKELKLRFYIEDMKKRISKQKTPTLLNISEGVIMEA